MKKLIAPIAGLAAALAVMASVSAAGVTGSAGESRAPEQATANIVDTAAANGNFKTLLAAVEAAGLTSTLKGPGPFTVFAPTDAAFAALPAGTVDSLLKDPAKLKDILLYHVVSGQVLAADAAKLTEAKTVQGGSLPIVAAGGTVTVGGAKVVTADVRASNGVIHVIDKVLIPPASAAPSATAAAATQATPAATPQAPRTGNAGAATDDSGSALWIGSLALVALALPVAARRLASTRIR
ncbi:MAG: fasciclin domain-containing protein [Dehalococcoidia bacterium]|nr:fasciclin domain-containing protein [Dehalococcoidia bacterium]